jgi:hypothetical protein
MIHSEFFPKLFLGQNSYNIFRLRRDEKLLLVHRDSETSIFRFRRISLLHVKLKSETMRTNEAILFKSVGIC